MNDAEDQIVRLLLESKKYGQTCPHALRRVARWAIERYKTPKAAAKAAKRKFHQVYGAYFNSAAVTQIDALVRSIPDAATEADLRTACLDILRLHASTAERIPILEAFYADLFRTTGLPATILDLACGLNPFALPWMGLRDDTEYWALDIDGALTNAVGRFFARLGRRGGAACLDVLAPEPTRSADVVFLLKALPCLEQQEKGVSRRLIERLRARCVVVSFPTKSLGGRSKGMREHYDRFMTSLIAGTPWKCDQYDYPSETVYILQGGNSCPENGDSAILAPLRRQRRGSTDYDNSA